MRVHWDYRVDLYVSHHVLNPLLPQGRHLTLAVLHHSAIEVDVPLSEAVGQATSHAAPPAPLYLDRTHLFLIMDSDDMEDGTEERLRMVSSHCMVLYELALTLASSSSAVKYDLGCMITSLRLSIRRSMRSI